MAGKGRKGTLRSAGGSRVTALPSMLNSHCTLTHHLHPALWVELLKEYLRERIDLDDFERKATAQLAAYEETEQKVRRTHQCWQFA